MRLETKAQKVTFWGALVGAATSFTAIGGAVLMWEDLRPWMSDIERKELHDRACENTLARIQTDLFRAQANQAEATERRATAADAGTIALNNKMIQQALEAQQTFKEDYAIEKKECGF